MKSVDVRSETRSSSSACRMISSRIHPEAFASCLLLLSSPLRSTSFHAGQKDISAGEKRKDLSPVSMKRSLSSLSLGGEKWSRLIGLIFETDLLNEIKVFGFILPDSADGRAVDYAQKKASSGWGGWRHHADRCSLSHPPPPPPPPLPPLCPWDRDRPPIQLMLLSLCSVSSLFSTWTSPTQWSWVRARTEEMMTF